MDAFPALGLGLGLRSVHFDDVLAPGAHGPAWFEVLTENVLYTGGRGRHVLERVAARWPVVLHGVSLSIGSVDPLDLAYVDRVGALARAIGAAWISDHLCWTGCAGRTTHDLLPMPLDEASLRHVVERVRIVQDRLGRTLVLENPSSYLQFTRDTIPEAEFLARLAEAADCALLVDVNNVYVSSVNHGFDPVAYLDTIPPHRVAQLHLAGHTHCGTHIVDTHDAPVIDAVWALYRHARARFGPVSTLLEWDANIPPYATLLAELEKAR